MNTYKPKWIKIVPKKTTKYAEYPNMLMDYITGLPMKNMTSKYGITPQSIFTRFRKMMSPKQYQRAKSLRILRRVNERKGPTPIIPDSENAKIIKMYTKQKMRVEAIADIYNTTPRPIYKILKKNKIKTGRKPKTYPRHDYTSLCQKLQEGKTPQEIHKELNIPIGTIYSHIDKIKEEILTYHPTI